MTNKVKGSPPVLAEPVVSTSYLSKLGLDPASRFHLSGNFVIDIHQDPPLFAHFNTAERAASVHRSLSIDEGLDPESLNWFPIPLIDVYQDIMRELKRQAETLLTYQEVATILKADHQAVRRMAKDGKLPVLTLSQRIHRFRLLDVNNYIQSGGRVQ